MKDFIVVFVACAACFTLGSFTTALRIHHNQPASDVADLERAVNVATQLAENAREAIAEAKRWKAEAEACRSGI